MARIPFIKKREDLPSEHQHIYDNIVRVRGSLVGPLTLILHSPALAARVAQLGNHVHYGLGVRLSRDPVPEQSLKQGVLELLVLTVAREHDAQYVWTLHEPIARQVGVREEAIVAIRDRKAPEGLTSEEKVVFQYIHELLSGHRVSEPTYQAALARFGTPGLVEITGIIGYYTMLSVTANAFEMEPDSGATPLLPV